PAVVNELVAPPPQQALLPLGQAAGDLRGRHRGIERLQGGPSSVGEEAHPHRRRHGWRCRHPRPQRREIHVEQEVPAAERPDRRDAERATPAQVGRDAAEASEGPGHLRRATTSYDGWPAWYGTPGLS